MMASRCSFCLKVTLAVPSIVRSWSSATFIGPGEGAAPGTASSPGPMKDVPADKLRSMLGIANVTFKQNQQQLAIIDTPLAG